MLGTGIKISLNTLCPLTHTLHRNMKKKFFLTITLLLTLICVFGQISEKDSSTIKNSRTNIVYFTEGVKVFPCDTIAFNNLITAQIKRLDREVKDKYFISSTINQNSNTLPNETNYKVCEDINLISSVRSKNGTLINSNKHDGKSLIYSLFRPFFNSKLNYYIIKVSHSNGEWGGATVLYYYKKRGQKFKYIKKHVTSVS